ncbi:hypothetical protein ACHQM5_009110 [Ranunculus cassubicifolius]
MEIISAAAGEATQSTIVHVEREFGYLIHFRRSTNTLKERIQQLTATKNDVQAMIDAALRNGELVKETVQEWMTRADFVLSQATEVSDEASVISSWFRGWWSCSRFSLGRKAEKKIPIIQELCVEGSGFGANNVSYRKPTQMLKMVVTKDFNAFASRDSTAEKILKAILDDATNLLGIHGMPGVGKTTLIKAIAKQVKEQQLFEEVVVVVVSQNPSLIKLQGDIAEALDLSLTGDNLSRRAERLFERLNQDSKTTLVILDDVWESIKLSEVGIPYENKGKCCKVVLTTRFGGVCEAMEADAKIEVAILPEEDSWILFQQKLGNVENSSLARDLLNECKGLPLAIVTLGLTLRNKDAIVWADALKQLRKSIYKGMSSVVSSIKYSYDFLESEAVKICFLFCCLFPEDEVIELGGLVTYVMGEKLLEDVETYDEAFGRLYSILDILASSGLLLKDEDGHVTMHDVVRDVAISIATEDHRFIVKAGRNLNFWPDIELGNCKRLSMMDNNIQCLPTIPIKAPYLQALFLNDNHKLKELPSDVFAEMKSLMTLDLSTTAIQSLPPSLSYLQNLRTLVLNYTSITNLSPIDKLEKLEVLSLRYSKVEEFPEEMGNLSNLKVLDLTATSLINSINPNIISKLHRLHSLHLWDSNVYQPNPNFKELEFFREIGSLSRLTTMDLQLHNRELCHIDIPGPWQNLTWFQIAGNDKTMGSDFSRSLGLEGIRGKQMANWILVLLGRTYFLQLVECPDFESVTEFGAAKGMNVNLKDLSLWRCPKMECLINNTGLLESNCRGYEFSHLEELRIWKMDAFVGICKGTNPPPGLLAKLKLLSFENCYSLVTAIPHKLLNLEVLTIVDCKNLEYVLEPEEEEKSEESLVSNICRISEPRIIFPNLKVFQMFGIPKIRYVFTMRVAQNLLLLELLQIKDCSEMEVLFKYGDGEDVKCDEDFNDTAILPRLKKLSVERAPKLKSFTNNQNLVMELPSLEYLEVTSCGMLERLPFGATSLPNLKNFEMVDTNLFDRLEWEDESVKSRLRAVITRVNFSTTIINSTAMLNG